MPVEYIHLVIAVIFETIGTSALQASHQFTKFWPSVLVVTAYAAAFFFLAMTLKTMPVGIAYALWSALGIVLISLIGFVIFGQRLDLPAIIGIGLILIGIVIIQAFSKTAGH